MLMWKRKFGSTKYSKLKDFDDQHCAQSRKEIFSAYLFNTISTYTSGGISSMWCFWVHRFLWVWHLPYFYYLWSCYPRHSTSYLDRERSISIHPSTGVRKFFCWTSYGFDDSSNMSAHASNQVICANSVQSGSILSRVWLQDHTILWRLCLNFQSKKIPHMLNRIQIWWVWRPYGSVNLPDSQQQPIKSVLEHNLSGTTRFFQVGADYPLSRKDCMTLSMSVYSNRSS